MRIIVDPVSKAYDFYVSHGLFKRQNKREMINFKPALMELFSPTLVRSRILSAPPAANTLPTNGECNSVNNPIVLASWMEYDEGSRTDSQSTLKKLEVDL